MNRTKMVAGLLAAVLMTASQSACGDEAKAAPDLPATAALLDKLELQVSGKVEELKAAEKLNYHRVEDGITDCMRKAGKRIRPLPYISFFDGFTDADIGYGTSRATPVDSLTEHGRRIVLNATAVARLQRSGVTARKLAKADVPALKKCTALFQSRGYHDFEPPAGVKELAGLKDLLDPVHSDPSVVSAMANYKTCMKQRYGYTVKERSAFLFAPRIDPRNAPLPGKPANAKWRKSVATIEKVFAADADCRKPAYEAAMTLLADRIEPWRERNRDKLFAVRAGWRKTVADAGKLS